MSNFSRTNLYKYYIKYELDYDNKWKLMKNDMNVCMKLEKWTKMKPKLYVFLKMKSMKKKYEIEWKTLWIGIALVTSKTENIHFEFERLVQTSPIYSHSDFRILLAPGLRLKGTCSPFATDKSIDFIECIGNFLRVIIFRIKQCTVLRQVLSMFCD